MADGEEVGVEAGYEVGLREGGSVSGRIVYRREEVGRGNHYSVCFLEEFVDFVEVEARLGGRSFMLLEKQVEGRGDIRHAG